MSEDTPSRGERTRNDILDAANRLFVERGYHGSSMRQIAQEAGIALGGIYNHFAGKEEIFQVVLIERHPIHELLPLLNQAQGENLEAFVRDASQRMIETLGRRRDFLNLIFIELVEFNARHLPEIIQRFLPETLQFANRLLQVRADLRPIPTPLIVRAFAGFFISYYVTDLLIGGEMPAEMRLNALDHFIDIFLHGILDDRPPAPPAE